MSDHQEVRAARIAATLVGALTVALACVAGGWNLRVLSVLALTLAASVLTPVLTYTLLWPGFTRTGALVTVYGSTALVVALTAGSPLISGSPIAAFPGRHFDWFPPRRRTGRPFSSKVSRLAAEALATGRGVRELVLERGLLTEEQLDRLLEPENLTFPGRPAIAAGTARHFPAGHGE